MTTRHIKICACEKQLFRVGRMSLRVCECMQVVKQRIWFCYNVKTCSSCVFDFNNSEMWSSSQSNNTAPCELNYYQSIASHGVIRPRLAKKVYFSLLFAHFLLVHMIKRISKEFSFHTMYYETRWVFYIPSPEAWGYKTHNSFHNTSYGIKIHLRSYICLYN